MERKKWSKRLFAALLAGILTVAMLPMEAVMAAEKTENTRTEASSSRILEDKNSNAEECLHTNTQIVNQKKPTCAEEGYTGDTKCADCGKIIKNGMDIPATGKHTYKNIKVTRATVKKDGEITQKCTKCGKLNPKKVTIYYPKTIKLSKTKVTYNGRSQKPSVTVRDRKGKKISSKYYAVSYKNNKNPGTAAVTIKFKGNYTGTVKKTFKIEVKPTSISKVSAEAEGFTVKWKRQSSQTSGYQIQYSAKSNFKGAKTITIRNNRTTSKTISNLKAKKKYYVRVRTYKKVKVNGKSKSLYSAWSKKKSVTVKQKPTPVYQAMIALKSKYPEGMPWTNANYYAWKGGIYTGGYGCAGFAFILSDAAFGDAPARIHTDFNNIREGDILRLYYNTHSVIVLEVHSDGVIVAEGNYNSSIHWGREISYSEIKQTGTYVLTRYP